MTCGCRCHTGGAFAGCTINTYDTGCGCTTTQADQSNQPVCVISHGKDETTGQTVQKQATDGLLCRHHAGRLHTWLLDIPVDFTLLPMFATSLSSVTPGDGSKPTKQPHAPAPVRLDVLSLVDDGRGGEARDVGDELWYESPDIPAVLPTLHAWAEQLRNDLDPTREERMLAAQRRGTLRLPKFTVHGEANYLIGAFASLVAAVWIDEAYRELRRVQQAMRFVIDPPQHLAALGQCIQVVEGERCPGQVRQDRYGGNPKCGGCGKVYEKLDVLRLERNNRTEAVA